MRGAGLAALPALVVFAIASPGTPRELRIGEGGDADTAATKQLKVGDNWFVRARGVPTVTVERGTIVRWRWTGRNARGRGR